MAEVEAAQVVARTHPLPRGLRLELVVLVVVRLQLTHQVNKVRQRPHQRVLRHLPQLLLPSRQTTAVVMVTTKGQHHLPPLHLPLTALPLSNHQQILVHHLPPTPVPKQQHLLRIRGQPTRPRIQDLHPRQRYLRQ